MTLDDRLRSVGLEQELYGTKAAKLQGLRDAALGELNERATMTISTQGERGLARLIREIEQKYGIGFGKLVRQA